MADRVQFRRDTAVNWYAYNPILLEGEVAYDLDSDQYKVGDGIHNWRDLVYRGLPCLQQRGESTTTPMSQKAVSDELSGIEDKLNTKNIYDENRQQYQNEINDEFGTYEDNPEFVRVYFDANRKVLWGLQKDGNIYYGTGVPKQIQDYINKYISDILAGNESSTDIDCVNKIITFLDGFSTSDGLKQYLEDEYGYYDDDIEFVRVYLTNDKRILWGIQQDGNIYFGAGIPRQIQDYIINEIAQAFDNFKELFVEKEDGKSLIDSEFADGVSTVDIPEYMSAVTDSNKRVLGGRKSNGVKFENVGFETPMINVGGNDIKKFEDPEDRSEILLDSSKKIISYRDKDGILHEEAGIESKNGTFDTLGANNLTLPENALEQVNEEISKYVAPKNWYLPKFGKVNIKSETFYLTADERWSDKNDIVCIQMLDDTAANAWERRTLSYYYIKSTLTPLSGGGYDRTSVNENSVKLDFYPAKEVAESDGHFYVKKITKVNGEFYFTSTLVATESGGVTTYSLDYLYGQLVSIKVNYADASVPDQTTLTNAIEVTQVVDTPQYKAWPVSKTFEHYCLADIDFGSFYKKNNVAAGIKYQGSGSTRYVKRGLRFTFYKNATYAKKDKVKIGEMVRLSGYNMKSYYQDNTRINDPVLSNLFIEVWETRGVENCYPWNKDNLPYNGATGFIKSFPIQTLFGGEFFGLQFFGLKKDERNYMLDGDDDSSGIFAIGDVQQDFYNANHTYCADEMMDEMSQETADALDELFKYATGFVDGTIEIDGQIVDFTNDMLEEHVDIPSWIDYWIGCQVFVMWDSTFHNAVMYSGRDKKKFYLFFYDLDMSIEAYSGSPDIYGSLIDIMAEKYSWVAEPKFWKKFTEVYKDNILNRYAALRKSVLTVENINAIYNRIVSNIPDEVLVAEAGKWGGGPENFKASITVIQERLDYLDNHYFCLNI